MTVSPTASFHGPLATLNATHRAAFGALLQHGRGAGAAAPPYVIVDASLPNQFEGLGPSEDAEFAEVMVIEELLR